MSVVNRCAVSIQARQPLIDWAKTVAPEGCEFFGFPPHVYLIPEYDFDEDGEELLSECCEWIFEEELCTWTYDRDLWPQDRNLEQFQQWFTAILHPLVIDADDEEELRNHPSAEEQAAFDAMARKLRRADGGQGFAD